METFAPNKHRKRFEVLAITEHLPVSCIKNYFLGSLSNVSVRVLLLHMKTISMWLSVNSNLDLPACQTPAWQTDERYLRLWRVVSQMG